MFNNVQQPQIVLAVCTELIPALKKYQAQNSNNHEISSDTSCFLLRCESFSKGGITLEDFYSNINTFSSTLKSNSSSLDVLSVNSQRSTIETPTLITCIEKIIKSLLMVIEKPLENIRNRIKTSILPHLKSAKKDTIAYNLFKGCDDFISYAISFTEFGELFSSIEDDSRSSELNNLLQALKKIIGENNNNIIDPDVDLKVFCLGSRLPMTISRVCSNLSLLICPRGTITFNRWQLSDLLRIQYVFCHEEIDDFIEGQNKLVQAAQKVLGCDVSLTRHIIEHFSDNALGGMFDHFITYFNEKNRSNLLYVSFSNLEISSECDKKLFIRLKAYIKNFPTEHYRKLELHPDTLLILEYYLTSVNGSVVCDNPNFVTIGESKDFIAKAFKAYIKQYDPQYAPQVDSIINEAEQTSFLFDLTSYYQRTATKHKHYDDSFQLKHELYILASSRANQVTQNPHEIQINKQLTDYLADHLTIEKFISQLNPKKTPLFGRIERSSTINIIENIISNHQKKLADFCLRIKKPSNDQLKEEGKTLEEYLLFSSIRSLSTLNNHYNRFNNRVIDDFAKLFLAKYILNLPRNKKFLENYFKMLGIKTPLLIDFLLHGFNQAAILGMYDPIVARCHEESEGMLSLREVASTCYINQDADPNKLHVQFTGYFALVFISKFQSIPDVPLNTPEAELAARFSSIQFNYELCAEGINISCQNVHYRVRGPEAAYLTQLLIDSINKKPIKLLSQSATPASQTRSRSDSQRSSTLSTATAPATPKTPLYQGHLFK